MITVVIPTYNRAYILTSTLPSYFSQKDVTEVILVDDGGEDETKEVLASIQQRYPHVRYKYIRHEVRMGAPSARNSGIQDAANSLILMGEDDAILAHDHASVLKKKLNATPNCAAVSGRFVQMHQDESVEEALARFGCGLSDLPPFRRWTMLLNAEAKFQSDQLLPMLPAILLASKDLLLRFPYEEEFGKGNGYREETTFQASAYEAGYNFLMTNDTHFFHLPRQQVQSGGQRGRTVQTYIATVKNNFRFLSRFYTGYQSRLKLKLPWLCAGLAFACYDFWYSVAKPLGSIYLKQPLKAVFASQINRKKQC